jgi:hypothetical protein
MPDPRSAGPDRSPYSGAMNALLPPLTLLVLLAGGFAPARAADIVTIQWAADGRFSQDLALPAAKFVELCGKIPPGAKVQWRFESGRPLSFNIHYHDGPKVHYPARQDGVAQASGVLEVQAPQDHC